MPRVVTGPRVTRSPQRTYRALGTGAVLLTCAGLLAVSIPLVAAPAGPVLVSVVAVAGVLLSARVPGIGAAALAAALGAAVLLLGAAVGGSRPAAATVAGGAALAVAGLTVWRLRRRREWAPWYGTRGVAVASAAAMAVLAVGLVPLADPTTSGTDGTRAVATAMSTVLPWAALVAASGWLRHPVAAALLAPALLQLVVVAAS